MKFAIEGPQSRDVDFDAVMNIFKAEKWCLLQGYLLGVPGKAGISIISHTFRLYKSTQANIKVGI